VRNRCLEAFLPSFFVCFWTKFVAIFHCPSRRQCRPLSRLRSNSRRQCRPLSRLRNNSRHWCRRSTLSPPSRHHRLQGNDIVVTNDKIEATPLSFPTPAAIYDTLPGEDPRGAPGPHDRRLGDARSPETALGGG
jgi:hypothetical protein